MAGGFGGTRRGATKGFQSCVRSRSELEMADLEALVVAGYVFADEYRVPLRGGRRPLISDAELVALAVAQAAIGISSDRQFLGLIGRVLPGWFPHLPDQVAIQPQVAWPGRVAVARAAATRALTRPGRRPACRRQPARGRQLSRLASS